MTIDEFLIVCNAIRPTERGCLEWPLTRTSAGYARFHIDGCEQTDRGHRCVLEIKLGRPIRLGMWALHSCDNPACIALDHLYEGTPKQNTADIAERDRRRFQMGAPSMGTKNGLAKADPELVVRIRRAYAGGERIAHIARWARLTEACVRQIAWRRTWKHVE